MKKPINIVLLVVTAIVCGCTEEFGSEVIKNGYSEPSFNYLYTFDCNRNRTISLWFPDYYNGDDDSVTATEWNTTFSVESSFLLSYINIDSTESWLTCKKLDGSNFRITASFNNSIYSRNGNVSITPHNTPSYDNNNYCISVYVNQPGRDLAIYQYNNKLSSSEQMIYFSRNGGVSKTYEVRADGDYTIITAPNDSWYSITHSKETNTFFVTANENSKYKIREGSITITLVGLPTGESKEVAFKVTQNS